MLEGYKDGQPVVYSMLMNAINNEKLSHAYIFDSNGNSDVFDIVLSFVKMILCKDIEYENEKSVICKRVDDGNYLDVKVIEPDGMWIKKDQLLDLQSEFNKRSFEGTKKIYIIKNAERMNPQTSNSILKFLEEPVDDIIAILVVDNVNLLLSTIISRCQCFSFKRISNDMIVDRLNTVCKSEGINIDEEVLEEIPAETEFIEEAVEMDELIPLEEYETENVEETETPLVETAEPIEDVVEAEDEIAEETIEEERGVTTFEETDEVILLEEEVEEELEAEEEPEAVEEYEAIVLVPAEENPPVVEETVVEESTEIKEEVSEIVEEKGLLEPNVPETVAPVVEETIVTPIVEPAPAATSYEKYIVPSLKDLESGKYYIQIATLGDDANIMEIVNKYGNNYPITIVPKSSGNAKQVMIGPITIDEYGALLQRFKSYGFKDAFLRKIR